LETIRALDHAIPFGLNVVVSPGHVKELRAVIELAMSLGAYDLLIIPPHDGENNSLTPTEWGEIDTTITRYHSRVRLSATYEAFCHLDALFLRTEREGECVFAHVSADKELRASSYGRGGIMIQDPKKMREYLLALRENEKGSG
jgi:MoaA/NifB/PqqE/SkfB family radical SAM enzyme